MAGLWVFNLIWVGVNRIGLWFGVGNFVKVSESLISCWAQLHFRTWALSEV